MSIVNPAVKDLLGPQVTVCKQCGLAIPKAWHIGYRTKDAVVDLHAWCVTEYEKTIKR